MNDTKWTPGPWQSRQTDKRDFRIEQEPCGAIVAKTFGGLADEERHNADLMAAAPELYEALRPFGEIGKAFIDARERLERGNGASSFTLPAEWVGWCISAVGALAKARGESQ